MFSKIPFVPPFSTNICFYFSFPDSADCDCLCHDRLHVFSPQCRGLQVMNRTIKTLIALLNCLLIAKCLSDGSGHHSWPQVPQQDTSSFILFTISSSKPSKFNCDKITIIYV